MKKITLTLIAVVAMLATASAQSTYKILYETDTIVKAKIESVSLGSRPVHYIIYEYPSKDGDGKDATVSGVVLIPSDVMDGSGFTFPRGNVDALRDTLQDLCDHPEKVEEHRDEARKVISAKYTWQDITAKTDKLYRKLLKKHEA